MSDYQPGDTVPREDLREGWRVRVEFEGTYSQHTDSVAFDSGGSVIADRASRIVLLDKPDPDAKIVEALAEAAQFIALGPGCSPWRFLTDEQREWSRKRARDRLALLREKGVLP